MINRSCNWLWSMVSIAKGWYLFMLCLTLILASILNLLIIYSWICSENRILAVKISAGDLPLGPQFFGLFGTNQESVQEMGTGAVISLRSYYKDFS